MQFNNITAISTATTTTVLSTADTFRIHTIIIPKATAGTITFEDIAGSPVTYFTLPAATVGQTMILDAVFPNGLKVVTASADTVLITWSQG